MFAEPWGIAPINKRARGIGALGILYPISPFFSWKIVFQKVRCANFESNIHCPSICFFVKDKR